MAAIAALLESRAAVLALRRTLPRGGAGVVTCRGPTALRRMLETRLVDAIVLGPDFGSAFTFNGTVSILFNTEATPFTATFTGHADVLVAGGPYFRVEVSNATLGILGAAITATSLSLEKVTDPATGVTTVTMSAAGLTLAIGDGGATPLVSVGPATGVVTITSTGVFADISGLTLTENIAGVDITGTAGLTLDTRNPSSQYVRITVAKALVSAGGFTIGGDLSFERVQVSPSRAIVKVGVTHLMASIGGVVSVTGGVMSITGGVVSSLVISSISRATRSTRTATARETRSSNS